MSTILLIERHGTETDNISSGGSGASFSLSVAADLVRNLGDSSDTSIEIIWSVREQGMPIIHMSTNHPPNNTPEMINWYTPELHDLQSSPLVTLHIHSTHTPSSPNTPSTPRSYSIPSPTITSSQPSSSYDLEKHPEKATTSSHACPNLNLHIQSGRPDIARCIKEVVESAGNEDRIAVVACGPEDMMRVTRTTVSRCIAVGGPSLELFCEQFGF